VEQVTQAISAAIQTCRSFPRPAELRELATNAPDRPLRAFAAFLDTVRHIGIYEPPPREQWEDQAAFETMRCFGGWRACRTMSEDKLREAFIKAYEKVSASAAVRNAPMLGHDGAVGTAGDYRQHEGRASGE
jgi:hypothetical protein